jgi:predicted PurR-regulated permease PerM
LRAIPIEICIARGANLVAVRYLHHDNYVDRALEVSIHVGLLILLATGCLLIVRPFLPLIVWGIIIAIAAYPAYRRLEGLLDGRSTLAAGLCTLCLLSLLIVPVVLLSGSFVEGIQNLVARLKEGTPIIPPPPPRVETWVIVGAPLKNAWELASKNSSTALEAFAPQIRSLIPRLLLASAGIGLGVLQWILSIVIAGVLLANVASGVRAAHSLTNRLFRDKGPEFEHLVGATIRSVTTGIIGVAVIQSVFAALGFLVARMPGAGLWAVTFLFAAVLQLGGLVLIPAVIYMFAIATATKAVMFLVWCVIVGVMDNALKPLLLGRGVPVPMAVVFLGVIGGFLAMGTIGLFVGAIVLSVGYKLSLAWLEGTARVTSEIPKHTISARVAS